MGGISSLFPSSCIRSHQKTAASGPKWGQIAQMFGQSGGSRARNPPQIQPEAEFGVFLPPPRADIYTCESPFWGKKEEKTKKPPKNAKKTQKASVLGSFGVGFFLHQGIHVADAVAHGEIPPAFRRVVRGKKTPSPKNAFFFFFLPPNEGGKGEKNKNKTWGQKKKKEEKNLATICAL